MLPQLRNLDGEEISPSERIKATQRLEDLLLELKTAIEMKRLENERKIQENIDTTNDYTKEYRRNMYKQLEEEKIETDKRKNPDKYKEKPISSKFHKDGSMRQCNEGKYKYILREWDDPEISTFTMAIPKYLETSMVDINVDPSFISVRVRDKLTQLRLNEEVIVENTQIQRSQITGELVITMKKLKPNHILTKIPSKPSKANNSIQKEKPKEAPKEVKEKENSKALLHLEEEDEEMPELE